MSPLVRALGATLLAAVLGAAGCGGDDDTDADAATTTAAPRVRTLTVCGVEQEVDRIPVDASRAGDFDAQAENALNYIDDILEVRDLGTPPADIAADYASVTRAYEVVREGFNAGATPEAYVDEVERRALEEFGSREEVDRFLGAYTAWVEAQCGFDPQLGIQLFDDE